MAQGDIKTVTILSNGYVAELLVESMGQSGSTNTGFSNYIDTLQTASTPTFVINVTSKGYDSTGAATSITRSVVGTKFVRMPYPQENFADHVITGSDVKIKVNLSDFFYSEDTGSLNISASFYTSASISSSALSSYTVINNSTAVYPKVIGNWYIPCWDIATGSTYPLRAGAFHRSAQQGKPVQLVVFTARDNSGNAISQSVTNMSIDPGVPDNIPVPEYIWNVPLNLLSSGHVITCSFTAYPWYGNTGSILDTNTSPHTHSRAGIGTPYYSNIYFLNDISGTYGRTVCVVDPVAGDNATGQAIDSASFNYLSPPNAFLTIAGALTSASAYNNISRSRNEPGGAIIYLMSGSYSWLGGTYSNTTIPLTYCTITNFPGVTRENVSISASVGSTDINDRVLVHNISINHSPSTVLFNGSNYLWINQCRISSSGASPIYANRCTYFTHNVVDLLTQGLSAYPGTVLYFGLIRGNKYQCNTSRYPGIRQCYTTIGNLGHRSAILPSIDDGTLYRTAQQFANQPTASNIIFAYNAYYKVRSIGNGSLFFYDAPTVPATDSGEEFHGCAIVQNLLEMTDYTSNSPNGWFAADGNVGETVNHLISWHNVWVGQRQSWGYNDSGSALKYKPNWSSKNNFADTSGTKTDVFVGWDGPNGARTGNWNIVNGVGHSGNFWGNVDGIANASIEQDFVGLKSLHRPTFFFPLKYHGYINRQGAAATASFSGSGNYALSASSPIVLAGNTYDWVLPYDMSGSARSATTSYPGPFRYGTDATGSGLTNRFYYDTLNDIMYAKQFVENSGFTQQMQVKPDGTVYLKGTKVVDPSYTKKFTLTLNGNLIAKQFGT